MVLHFVAILRGVCESSGSLMGVVSGGGGRSGGSVLLQAGARPWECGSDSRGLRRRCSFPPPAW